MKRLMMRASSLLKGFVLALIFSVFLQASLASANGDLISLNQENFYTSITTDINGDEGGSFGLDYILIEDIDISDIESITTVFTTFSGTLDGDEFIISGLTTPLFGELIGDISNLNLTSAAGVTGNGALGALAKILYAGSTIDNVSFVGTVTGTGSDVGGLVGVSYGTITNSYATGVVTGDDGVGGLVGSSSGAITDSYAAVTVLGIENVGGLVGYNDGGTITNSSATGAVTGGGFYVGGLVGTSTGTITDSSATGTVTGTYDVGGLVGTLFGTITNSYAVGGVSGSGYIGGLVGSSSDTSTITDSYATGGVDGDTSTPVGGLVGASGSIITNSYADGDVLGINQVGGLVGWQHNGTITNSYAVGDVTGIDYVGGLVGDSLVSITNSYAVGDVTGIDYVGGLIGHLVGDENNNEEISNSYAVGDVTSGGVNENVVGRLVGFSDGSITVDDLSLGYGVATINGVEKETDLYSGTGLIPNILGIVNTGYEGTEHFAVNASINDGLPYLISLIDSYDVVEEDTEETPSFSLRSYYTQAAKSLDKALISFGFKSNFSSHPTLGFQALEQNQSKLPAVIQLFEVFEYQNSRILLSKEDGLQLSISSYYKEAVEIWTQGLDGEYLYLGLVEFNKDGKAILPALKFDTTNTYQLLMIKAADKLSQKPNLEAKVGQITINVI